MTQITVWRELIVLLHQQDHLKRATCQKLVCNVPLKNWRKVDKWRTKYIKWALSVGRFEVREHPKKNLKCPSRSPENYYWRLFKEIIRKLSPTLQAVLKNKDDYQILTFKLLKIKQTLFWLLCLHIYNHTNLPIFPTFLTKYEELLHNHKCQRYSWQVFTFSLKLLTNQITMQFL